MTRRFPPASKIITFRLTPEQAADVLNCAKQLGETVSEFARTALAWRIAHHHQQAALRWQKPDGK